MTATESAGWIADRVDDFRALDRRILDLQHRAAVWTAGQLDGSSLRAQGRDIVEALGGLLRFHQSTVNRLDQVAGALPDSWGLGALPVVVPVAWAGAVIALAGAMAWIFRRVTAEERALELLEAGQVTPAEAIRIAEAVGRPPSLIGGAPIQLATLAILAAGGWWLYRRAS
jgi:hypothetical protein